MPGLLRVCNPCEIKENCGCRLRSAVMRAFASYHISQMNSEVAHRLRRPPSRHGHRWPDRVGRSVEAPPARAGALGSAPAERSGAGAFAPQTARCVEAKAASRFACRRTPHHHSAAASLVPIGIKPMPCAGARSSPFGSGRGSRAESRAAAANRAAATGRSPRPPRRGNRAATRPSP